MARKATAAKSANPRAGKSGPRKTKGGPDEIDVHVGSRVRLRRMILGMSQESLGNALGLTFQQVQKYEKGANRIGAGRLMQLAELLDVPIQFFYEDFDRVAGAPGLAEDAAADDDSFMKLIQSQEGIQLCRYFSEIRDPKVKKRVLELVRSISETEAAPSQIAPVKHPFLLDMR